MKAENNRYPYVTTTPGAEPALPPDVGDRRVFVDSGDGVLKEVSDTGVVYPHAPIYLVENGAAAPTGLAPGTIIAEKG